MYYGEKIKLRVCVFFCSVLFATQYQSSDWM